MKVPGDVRLRPIAADFDTKRCFFEAASGGSS